MSEEKKAPEVEVFHEHEVDIPIKIEKDGTVRDYVLKEMNGDDLGKWMKIWSGHISKNAEGTNTAEDFASFHSELISLCLYTPDGGRVAKAMIDLWGARIKNSLFGKCQVHNGLTEASKATAGKA